MLEVPIEARLRGRIKWSVFGPDDEPVEVDLGNGTRAHSGECPNLITDAGMDSIPTHDIRGTNPAMRRYLAIGTGSTEPAVTDVALDNEVMRAYSTGGFPTIDEAEYDAANDVVRWRGTVPRLITLNADYNLTEYGFFESSAGGDALIRELFRDDAGTPITLSLLSGYKLLVEHTLTIELPWLVQTTSIDVKEYDASGSLVSTTPVDVEYGFCSDEPDESSYEDDVVRWMIDFWQPSKINDTNNYTYIASGDQTPWSRTGPAHPTPNHGNVRTYQAVESEPYVAGSFSFTWGLLLSESLFDGDFYGMSRRYATSGFALGQYVYLKAGAFVTKDGTQTLKAGFTSTWARA